ncbi:TetR/AcrR family transcriptional regulator C-terminal domain-containing protein [Kineosporia rhizophila]|uniref:TetR/AcrR family transcriptional regulator C-terminal domain-containing protein n=1 Tax=Kineosporia rhizophila TaxID=84633 RepID=UPI001E3E40C8|nr:TetR/AcrR family transcriptional regulator C-terminal domain-containing protein [Kineosporia rhizophila]
MDDVVTAALDLLDEVGADAVSLRAVANRLGVRMNTVLWHAKSRADLQELMADAIVAGISTQALPADPPQRAEEIVARFRVALLARRDGARVVTGTFAARPGTLRFAELLVASLVEGGLDEREAAWTLWSLVYFTLGLVAEEQAAAEQGRVAEQLVGELAGGAYPTLSAVRNYLTGDFEERFRYGVRQFLPRH